MNNIYFFFFYSLISMQLSSFAADDRESSPSSSAAAHSTSSRLLIESQSEEDDVTMFFADGDDKENAPSDSNIVPYGSPVRKLRMQRTRVLSPSKQLVKRGEGDAITPFGLKISLPPSLKVVDPLKLDEGYLKYYKNLHQRHQQASNNFWQKKTTVHFPLYTPVSAITRNPFPAVLPPLESILQQNLSIPYSSALCHSQEHQTRLYLLENIEDAMIYEQYVKAENPAINKQELDGIAHYIMEGFCNSLSNPLDTVQTACDFQKHLDMNALMALLKPEQLPLAFLLDIYKTNQDLFKKIAAQDFAGESAFEKTKDKNAFAAQYINNYSQLITQRVFTNILHENYKNELETNKKIYDLINQWHFIAQTFAVTSLVGTPVDKNAGISIYNEVMFPILNHLFLNQKEYYYSLQIFSYTLPQATRFNVIKLKIRDVTAIPAIVLCAFPPAPIVEPQAPKQTTAPKKESKGCVIS